MGHIARHSKVHGMEAAVALSYMPSPARLLGGDRACGVRNTLRRASPRQILKEVPNLPRNFPEQIGNHNFKILISSPESSISERVEQPLQIFFSEISLEFSLVDRFQRTQKVALARFLRSVVAQKKTKIAVLVWIDDYNFIK